MISIVLLLHFFNNLYCMHCMNNVVVIIVVVVVVVFVVVVVEINFNSIKKKQFSTSLFRKQ